MARPAAWEPEPAGAEEDEGVRPVLDEGFQIFGQLRNDEGGNADDPLTGA